MSVPMPISSATLFNAMVFLPFRSFLPSFAGEAKLTLRQSRLDEQRLHLDIVLLGEGAVLGRVLVPRQLEELLQVLVDLGFAHRFLEGEVDRLDHLAFKEAM